MPFGRDMQNPLRAATATLAALAAAAGAGALQAQDTATRSYRVAVTTDDGQPAAHVKVDLLPGAGGAALDSRRTDAHGVATFELTAQQATPEAVLHAAVVTRTPVRCALGAPDDERRLVLPPCGALEVELETELLPGTEPQWDLRLLHAQGGCEPDEAAAGRARFEHVEAGIVLVLVCRADGRAETFVVNPVVAGECSRDAFEFPALEAIALRLLDADGAPLREAQVRGHWQDDEAVTANQCQTNPEGWLQLWVPVSARNGSTLYLAATAGDTGELLGTVELQCGAFEQRRHLYGEHRVTAAVPGCSGVVRTPDDRPLAGVPLTVTSSDPHARIRRFTTTTRADGTFTFLMDGAKHARLELRVPSSDWFLVDAPRGHLDLAATERDLVIRAQPAARIRFGMPGLPADVQNTLHLMLRPHGDDEAAARHYVSLQSDRLRTPAGDWDLVFASHDTELHRIEGLHAAAGIETHDARMMFVDWRAFAELVTLRVQDEHGRPCDTCSVAYPADRPRTQIAARGGVVHWLVAKDAGTFRIQAGAERITLENVHGDVTVRLGCGPVLVVTLPVHPALPDGARLVAVAGEHEQPFDENGRAELCVDKSGRWRARLFVVHGERRREIDVDLPELELGRAGATLAVPDGGGLAAAIEHALGTMQ